MPLKPIDWTGTLSSLLYSWFEERHLYYVNCKRCSKKKMVGQFYHSRKYLTIIALLYLYKSQVHLRKKYCFHIWAVFFQCILPSLCCLVLWERFTSHQFSITGNLPVCPFSIFVFHGKCHFFITCNLHPNFFSEFSPHQKHISI